MDCVVAAADCQSITIASSVNRSKSYVHMHVFLNVFNDILIAIWTCIYPAEIRAF